MEWQSPCTRRSAVSSARSWCRRSITCSMERRRSCSGSPRISPRFSSSPFSSGKWMDSFGNYPREKFDPFSVMLFKALQVVACRFVIALLVMNPEAKSGKIDTKAEFIITLTWPDSHPDDVDLYAEDPVGHIVWHHARQAGFMVLDRDDRGGLNNTIIVNGKKISSPIRQETVSIRGIVPGEYTVNVNHYLATSGAPWRVAVKVEKVNPPVEVVHYDTLILDHTGQERTAVRFRLADSGRDVANAPLTNARKRQ